MYVLSPFYHDGVLNKGLHDTRVGVKVNGVAINNITYADNISILCNHRIVFQSCFLESTSKVCSTVLRSMLQKLGS